MRHPVEKRGSAERFDPPAKNTDRTTENSMTERKNKLPMPSRINEIIDIEQ